MRRTLVPLFAVLLTTAAFAQDDGPSLEARLFTEQVSVAPGESTALAIELKIEPDWHIYHPIVLDTGLPTTVTLGLPAGTTAAPVQYPKPYFAALETGGDPIKYLGYKDTVVLLTDITAGDNVKPGQAIIVEATVDALICEDNGKCIPVQATAGVSIPVTAETGDVQFISQFEAAREALPMTLDRASYIKGSHLTTRHSKLPIGADGELVLTLTLGKNLHVQDRDPGNEALIPTRVWIESLEGLTFDVKNQVWPEPKLSEVEYLGKVRHQYGDVVIRTPFKVTYPGFKPGPVTAHVLVQYQACTESGQCFAPEMAIGAVTFDVVSADAKAAERTERATVSPGWEPQIESGATPIATRDRSEDAPATAGVSGAASGSGLLTLLGILGGAFLGGIILNIMPCVLPVVSLKIFGFVNQAGEAHDRILKMGLMYAVGVLVSFLPLAIAIAAFNQAWGGVIFQNPVAIMLLSGFMLTFGLSMVGLYEMRLPGSAENVASGATTREGYGGAFLSGLVTTALATPCTGPFLGPALGALATQPPAMSFLGVMLVGAGLAFPYVLLSAVPAWVKFLPKPGKWMIAFKQITGLVILAVPLWLLWVLSTYGDAPLLFGAIVFLFGVGVASFVFGKIDINASTGKTTGLLTTAAVVMLAGWYIGPVYFGQLNAPIAENEATEGAAIAEAADIDVNALYAANDGPKLAWQKWQPGLPEKLAEAGYTVYVDFTATWCATCQVNKNAVLHTNDIYAKFREQKIIPLTGDFTRRDPAIHAELKRHGRNGVPLNLVYPANRPTDVIAMPELLTQSIVTDALDRAGASTASGAQVAAAN
jgi:thiol:disulfide interchange protein